MTKSAVGRNILFFTCAGHLLVHVIVHLFTPIQVEMRQEFGLSDKSFTAWASISLVLFGAGAIPAGWLSDLFGEKPLLVAFYLVSALGALAVGLAQAPWHLGIGFALIGIGTSIYHPVGLAMISKGLVEPAKAMGVNGLFGSLGTAFSPIVARELTRVTGDWRWAFLGLIVPLVVLGVWMARSDLGGKLDHDVSSKKRSENDAPSSTARTPSSLYAIMTLLLLAMLCGGVYYSLIITKLPDHLASSLFVNSESSDALTKGWIPFLIFSVGGLSQVLGGNLVATREGRGMYVLILLFATPLIYAVGKTSGGVLVGTGCLMAFFMFAVQPVENTLLARYSPAKMRGRLFGLKFIVVFGAGMGAGTFISGGVADEYSLGAVFTVSAAFTSAALVLAIAAWRIPITPRK